MKSSAKVIWESLKLLIFNCVFAIVFSLISLFPLFSQTTFTVNSIDDFADTDIGDAICQDFQGNCTLRAAIEQANNIITGVDTIRFNVPGPGPHTIQPGSALPTITSGKHRNLKKIIGLVNDPEESRGPLALTVTLHI